MKTIKTIRCVVPRMAVLIASASMLVIPSFGENGTWTNLAGGAWSTSGNWTNGTPAQYGSVSTILNFNVAGTYTSSNNWTGTFTNNSLAFGAGTVTLAGGTLAFMNNDVVMPVVTNYGATVTIKNPLLLATNTTFAGANNTTASGVISGSGGIIQAGSGTLTLSGANTFTGGTTINSGGTLAASVAGALGTAFSGPLVVNGTLNLTAGGTTAYTFSNSISGNGTINVTVSTSAQAVTFSSNPTWTNFAGTLNIGVNQPAGSGRATIYADLPSGATVNVTTNSGLLVGGFTTCSAAVNLYGGTGNNGFQFYFASATCSGPITLYADTTFGGLNGTSTISGNIGDGGRSCGITKGVCGGNVILSGVNTYSGDTRCVGGTGWFSVRNALALQNSTVDMNASDAGSIGFSQNSTLGGLKGSRDLDMSNRTLKIGNNNKDTSYSGVLTNGAVIKIGSGALTLSGTNTYTGATTVSNGILAVSGVLSSSGVTVCTGAVFAAGSTGVVGRATLGGTLTFQNNSALLVDVAPPLADAVEAAGNVVIGTGVEVRLSGNQQKSGSWEIIKTTSGTITGDPVLINGLNGAKLTRTATAIVLTIPPRGTMVQIF